MALLQIPNQTARQILLSAQRLDDTPIMSGDRAGTYQIIDQLGYVQIDTISVIERSHHHTLWTRQDNYQKDMLHDLHATDRKVFEYWTHAMSYVPMTDFRYFLPKMRKFHNPTSKWAQYQMQQGFPSVVFGAGKNPGGRPARFQRFPASPGSQRGNLVGLETGQGCA